MAEHPHVSGLVIEHELGHGAHSVVYRARHHGVPCAVKFPRVKARWTRWIYREAVSLARVRHALLPAVLEVGEVDGLPYLVMELVEGTTLADKLAGGPLEEEAAIDIALQLASVLAAVHDAGLVHRDVKPRNVLVERTTGALRLVDFGFATPMERLAGPEPAGTEAYAAPEQLAPPGNVDARTDLYAVGRILFESLSGLPLSARGDGPWGPSARAELVARGISPNLAEVVSHLLRHSPRDRYPNAHALASELQRLRDGHPPQGPAAFAHRKPAPVLDGRAAELERILAPCRNIRAGGALVVVRGPRGGGKSQLLACVEAESRAFARTIHVSCQKDDPPLSTLRRILDSHAEAHLAAAGRADDFRSAIGNLSSVVQIIAPAGLMTALEPFYDVRTSRTRQDVGGAADSLVEGAAELLLRLASRITPTVIVIDDGQWMDPASTDALVRVAHRIAEAPIALVIATRPTRRDEGVDRFSKVRAARSTEVEIPRLRQRDVAALVAHHLGRAEVDPAIAARIHSMADGTPLGVLEVLGAFLDAGVVRPHARGWKFDVERSDSVVLPAGAHALLGRRLGELPAATRRVLEAAAILGTRFDDEILGVTVELKAEDLPYPMASARRAGLIEPDERGTHRFIHDSLREMLVEELAEPDRRRLHQRVAEVLSLRPDLSFDELCAAARHFGAGETEKTPEMGARIARAAGEAALARFDNETALRFLTQARVASDAAHVRLDTAFFRSIGEAHLRIGALEESIAAFELGLELAPDAATRAAVLGRLSWVYQTRAEPDRAWELLDRAFLAVGHKMPIEDAASAAATSMHLARFRLGRFLVRTGSGRHDEIDLLSALHYQNARLGLEYGKPARLIQSSLESLSLSERGGSLEAQARARAFYALVVTVLLRGEAGPREIAKAKAIAARHGDAATMAFCVQIEFVAACWGGDFDRGLTVLQECIDVHGPWLELNEYSLNVSTADLLQWMRGRASDAWSWIDRAIERLRRTRSRPVIAEFLIHRARAALAAVGRTVSDDVWLADQLASVSPRDPGHGFHRIMSWGPRARYYLEADDLGVDFDDLVRAFEAENHNPRSVHLGVTEYYVAVAHARLQQVLRTAPIERARRLPALRKAATDLDACAKVPLLKAHAQSVRGYLAWFEGDHRKAKKLLAEAEATANQQSCPWGLYSVARARAHMLRASGKEQAAHDQASVALLLAREHGAVTRARWIREEFGLVEHQPHPSSISSHRSSSSRTTRHLAALLQVARAPRRDLRTEQQGSAVLDELISSLHASRGAIWFQPEPNTAATAVSRQRGREGSPSVAPDSPHGALLRAVHQMGMAWPPLDGEGRGSSSKGEHSFDPSRMMAVPLFLYERPVGALCIERSAAEPTFATDDRTLLLLLSHQVPVTLEMARLLFEREQLHSSLQQAKKMEAMGQLAGGLAHDFNNMLGAMKVALSTARELAHSDTELVVELDVISEATTRAAQLTSQLLSFSRHQPVPAVVHDVNQLISTLEPMLRRVVGSKVAISTSLSPAVDQVEVDQGSFDQALVNLFINARDAMPNGGSLAIKTRNVVLGELAAQQLSLTPGTFVEVEIKDTGEGINAETLTRIFEPFFTTKPAGSGSGLGLAMVYAFARNCGGSIDVSSEVGQGTQFRLYLRTVARIRHSLPARASHGTASLPPANEHGGLDTILVVDDDDLVRRSIAKTLERNGYRVVAASGSREALDVARDQGARIGLVILDVLMPGVTGPELGRRLIGLNLSAKLLFVSGFSPESIPFEEAQVAAEMLLQKPFSQATLLERVRQLMQN